ncbi:glycine-rich domain-containing protein [Pseudomonas sp. EL_65y_Pfl2_R96]|uniref:glycine-rich domain-containing protein n=1 Tax=Pseudomonas sp. EL_65y_Pfl2_R96 TaxID=3088699 RepID=UPI0030DB1B8F
MADLPESPNWAPGVYQLETSDPVLGGPEGITNLPAKQLANRTGWLKKKIDALLDGTGIPFASQREAEKGSNTNKPMNALRVFQAIGAKVVQATESVPGIARIATQIMVKVGTNNRTMVTPETLAAMFPFRGRAVFNVRGVYTWDVPSGVTKAWVVVIAGGGGGARSGSLPGPSGGSGGGIAKKLVDLTGITSVTVTVGAGGVGGLEDGNAGTNGGTSSFGTTLWASNGVGGFINGQGPQGGQGVGGDENGTLGQGGLAVGDSSNTDFLGGGGGGGVSKIAGSDKQTPRSPGQGGGGRSDGPAPDGADGQITIQW